MLEVKVLVETIGKIDETLDILRVDKNQDASRPAHLIMVPNIIVCSAFNKYGEGLSLKGDRLRITDEPHSINFYEFLLTKGFYTHKETFEMKKDNLTKLFAIIHDSGITREIYHEKEIGKNYLFRNYFETRKIIRS